MRILKQIIGVILLVGVVALPMACGDREVVSGPVNSPVDQDEDNTSAVIDENYVYKLPVIFHVLYVDESDPRQYIPAERLAQILQNVNDLFKGKLYTAEFGTTSEDMGVEFLLATHDEKGNKLATPGVEYVRWTGTWPIDPSDFMANNKANVGYIWEPNEYINVMLYHFPIETSGETLGISHLPYVLKGINEMGGLSALDASKANIGKASLGFAYCSSINSRYAYKDVGGAYYETDRYTNASHRLFEKAVTGIQWSHDINVTMAHELAHYLGLRHVFAEQEGTVEGDPADVCDDTDYCDDTPSYNRQAYLRDLNQYIATLPEGENVQAQRLVTRSNCQGEVYYSANIMDYSYTYGFKFSANQKERVRNVLYNSPLIPGPKKRNATSRTIVPEAQGTVDLPIRMIR